jgi:3-oxocholest-4-en-26-oate---CoA ligase
MTCVEWSLPAVLDAVTEAVPDRDMLVWGSGRRTFAEVQDRTRRLARFLAQRGVSIRKERSELERWECGQAMVALLMSNGPEYVEAMIGSFRSRAVPYNINHHYQPAEVAALLNEIGADAVIYHRRLGALLAADPGLGSRVLIDVDDGSGTEPLPRSTSIESARADGTGASRLAEPTPDDLYMVCTGGTTGSPKGVLWRQADVYVGAMGGTEEATKESIQAAAAQSTAVWFPACPLMHSAAQWTTFSGLHGGATVVLHDTAQPFDARTILETAEREGVTLMAIVGDAYARPLVEELRRRPYDLSHLERIGTGGAVTSAAEKEALLDLLPHVTVVDGYGSSETGGMAFGASRRSRPTRDFFLSQGGGVLSADRSRFLEPGDDEVGWTARTGRIPLGYLNDRARTERTFPVVAGRRVSVPGDRARLNPDGTINMLGRDSMVVNSGGEKVFVEEVEEIIRQHPDVADALVVGRPSDRFGEEVVALVQPRPGRSVEPGELREYVAATVARFKAPRAVLVCERIERHATGKPDYSWARQAATDAVSVGADARVRERRSGGP